MPSISRNHASIRIGALAFTLVVSGLVSHHVQAQDDKKVTDLRILFVSDRETPEEYAIYAMNPDGSGQTRISKGKGMAFDPVWSPDHKQILFSFVASKEMPKCDLKVMKADGSEPTLLVPGEEKTMLFSPSWSPDGKWIVYYSMRFNNNMPEAAIYGMDADGKNRKKLGDGMIPVWAPDNKHILFSPMLGRNGPPELKIMDSDGTNAKTLTAKGLGPSYSPDGKRILFTSGDDRPNVFVMDADGMHVTQLTKAAETGGIGPVWTPDGKHILFTQVPRDVAGRPKLVICQMDADGGNVKEIQADSFVGIGPSLFLLMMAAGR